MSIAEIERFAADLTSNEALRAEAGKHDAERHHETPIAYCVSFAASKGYTFTADEAMEHIKGMAKAAGREHTDAELGGVSGGILSTSPENLSDQARDDLKAKNLFLTQMFDLQAAILKTLNNSMQNTARNIKG